jgi:hypothetical protein
MHDTDRTQLETQGAESESLIGEFGEIGVFGETESGQFAETPLSEIQEMELASELLEVSTEQEFEQFLGSVFRTVGSAAGRFIRSDTGRALGGILKSAARQALPIVGRSVGQWMSPQGGGDIGARLATRAGRIFGLELEGLSPQDMEFEVARQFVRFAGAAAAQATRAPSTAPASTVARTAAVAAARVHAPGLLPRLRGRSGTLWPRSGRWARRGRTIVLYGG